MEIFSAQWRSLQLPLRQNADIKGIQCAGLQHKVLCGWDDTLLCILQPLLSLPELMVLQNLAKYLAKKVIFRKAS